MNSTISRRMRMFQQAEAAILRSVPKAAEQIARGAIERHLGDGAETADAIYDAAFSIAHDALLDAGYDSRTASRIASEQAQLVAQP